MSSLFNHVFIPLVILLAFSDRLGLDPKKVFALVFFAILPDADVIIQPHRAAFHNIFALIIPLLLFILISNRRETSGIICLYLASHLTLDLFNGGISLLYPLSKDVFFVSAELRFDLQSFTHMLEYGVRETVAVNGKGEPLVSSENTGIAVLLTLLGIILAVLRRKEKF
ncbi:MAG: metal-dependent hydrolase [Candidatus Methanoperedens sp.]|nr:metal-dependent hydrolase [Candidatus Methanoperedens sp.]